MKHPLKKWLIGSTAALLIAGGGGTVYHYQNVKAEETAQAQRIADTLTTYKDKVAKLYATSSKDALKKDVTHDTADKLVKQLSKLNKESYSKEDTTKFQTIDKEAKEALAMIDLRDAVLDYIKTPTDKKLNGLNKQMKSLETTKKTFVADQHKQIKEAQKKVKQAQEKKKAEQEQKKQAELAQKQAESQAVITEQEAQQAVEATNQAQDVPEANQEQATNTQGNTSSNTNTATNNAPSNNQGNTQNNAASNTNQGNTATNNSPSSSTNKPSSNNGSSNNDYWEGEVEWTEGGVIGHPELSEDDPQGHNTWTGGEFDPGDIDW